jgi:hypothetical protein
MKVVLTSLASQVRYAVSPCLSTALRDLLAERHQASAGVTTRPWNEWTLVAIRLRMVRTGQDTSEVDALLARMRADTEARMVAVVAEIVGAMLIRLSPMRSNS